MRYQISRQCPNANPVDYELTRLCRCSQYIVGAVPTGNRFSGIHIMVIISDCLSEDGSSILPCRASLVCESGGTVYTADLKSAA